MSMMHWARIVALSLTLQWVTQFAPAQEETLDSEVVTAETQAVDASKPLRDPFWPVGWKPSPKIKTPDAAVQESVDFVPQWGKVLNSIQVSSLTETFVKGTYIAVIKGVGIVEKGDILPIKHDGYTYHILIKDITSQGIVPEKKSVLPSN